VVTEWESQELDTNRKRYVAKERENVKVSIRNMPSLLNLRPEYLAGYSGFLESEAERAED